MTTIMYEMYPDAWTDEQANRRRHTDGDQPRRRVRKPHSVVPAIILEQSEASRDERRD
jgi:hypothetical protein